MNKLLVISVDRDNDLGRKATVQGPVIGRENNIKAATKLAISDPGEADANCIFAAVKKFDELKKQIKNLEIATVTGHGKSGFASDRIINEQLDAVLKKFEAEGFVLVTDGAEDDQIIPILQSRAKIVSKEVVIIKQAQAVESVYFTIKEALKDPYIARILFGIPGIMLLLVVALGSVSLQILAFILGAYLLLKGFGIEETVLNAFRNITESISVQRTSFPFYIGSIFIIAFGALTAYNNFITTQSIDLALEIASVAQSTYLFIALTALGVVIGRSIDAVHFRKAYLLRNYFLSGVSIFLIWFLLESGTMVFLRQADLNWFLGSILATFIILLIAFKVSKVMDIRHKITRLVIGLPVYNSNGMWLGRVTSIDQKKNAILYTETNSEKTKQVSKSNFMIRGGRILVSG